MNPLIPVMFGGALGAGARYLSGTLLAARLDEGFPWGTLTANLLGGLLMGLLAAALARGGAGEGARLFLGVGMLGGFTTFSAFSLESWQMVARGEWAVAGGYALVSIIGSVLTVGAGLWLGRGLA
jgi:fluoride exporter